MYFTNTDLNHRPLVRKAAAFGDADGRAVRLHQDSPDPSTEPVSAFSPGEELRAGRMQGAATDKCSKQSVWI